MTLSILSILAALILPSAQLMAKRTREVELRRNLRVIRNAIDDYKKTYDKATTEGLNGVRMMTTMNKSGYPESFEKLLEGDTFGGVYTEKKKFLRRVPCDPFFRDTQVTCDKSWGARSYSDKECSDKPGTGDIYDVCSMSEETAIDGTKYKDW
ncbi:MAG: type II secretion system protein [Geobacteraceae bacterium]|nr:type II secretion system protein [Geobacteraceae bacterium]